MYKYPKFRGGKQVLTRVYDNTSAMMMNITAYNLKKGVNINSVVAQEKCSAKKLEKSFKKVLTNLKRRCIINKLAKNERALNLEN